MSSSLAAPHDQLLTQFVRITAQRAQQHVREFELALDEFCQDHAPAAGDILNNDEVNLILQAVKDEVRHFAEKELDSCAQLSTAMVKQLLLAAERQGAQVDVDLSRLDSLELLADAAGLRQQASLLPTRSLVPMPSLTPLSSLNSVKLPVGHLSSKLQPTGDSAVAHAAPSAEVESLKMRLQAMSDRSTEVLREKTALNQEIDKLRQELGSLRAEERNTDLIKAVADTRNQNVEAATASYQLQIDELQSSKASLESLVEELKLQVRIANDAAVEAAEKAKVRILEAAKAEENFQQRLGDSKQVQQLLNMLKQKSQDVVELRRRLNAYEQDDVPTADD